MAEGIFKMSLKRNGFTTIELLTVIAIIAVMVGILIPAVTYVRNSANIAKQKAQFAAIAMALDAFKGDYGDYPPSHGCSFSSGVCTEDYSYCGAQTLAEALVGWDLLGFDPNSAWRSDGKDSGGINLVYNSTVSGNLAEREGPYLELGTASAFTLSQLFPSISLTNLADRYVLCDSFGAKSVTVNGKTVKAGRPILYYKANVANKAFGPLPPSNGTDPTTWIYNYIDNINLIILQVNFERSKNPLYSPDPLYNQYSVGVGLPGTYLYSPTYKLLDQKVYSATAGAVPWPCRPDSYILISAGVDGLYGTDDDITNF
jgi:prepilin-type N-terminal cleavage/methylation domain-containing protein